MSIVIRRKNGDIMWFDAITQFGLTYQSSVTKHPIAIGGYVSDHTTNENLVINLNGVLTDADFNLNRPANLDSLVAFDLGDVSVDENGLYKPVSKQYTTNNLVTPVTIKDKSTINKILPEVIAQFTKDSIPTAVVTPQDRVKTARTVKRELISMRNNREEFQVLDLLDDFVMNTYGPCIFTNLTFSEDPESGEGIFPNMTIEEVTFTDLEEIKVKVKSKTSNKGRKTGTATKKETEIPPDNNPTNNVKKDSSIVNTTKNNVQAKAATGG